MQSLTFVGTTLLCFNYYCLSGCHSQEAYVEPSQVRVYRTPNAIGYTIEQGSVRASAHWPAPKQLGSYEIADLATPLIDLSPEWGQYIGISQSETSGGELTYRENPLDVELASVESVDEFVTYCTSQGYEDCIILVYTSSDNALLLSGPEIEERFQQD